MSCDDSVKSAYSPDGDTMVVAIRAIKKGDNLIAVDSPSPIKTAKSYSEGIGIGG